MPDQTRYLTTYNRSARLLASPPVSELIVNRQGAVIHLRLNRPDQLNALSLPLMKEMRLALTQAATDRKARALVLTGAGRMFCAGADVKTFGPLAEDPAGLRAYFDTFEQTVDQLAALPLPTVAGIHGGCFGGGMSLAMACDQRIGDSTGRFALPPARLGLNYGRADMRRLVRTVGHATASDLLIGARQLDAGQAHDKGLLQYLCKDGEVEVEQAALQMGEKLADLSLSSIGFSKKFLDDLSANRGDDSSGPHFVDSPEIVEGIRAFAERRTPRFDWHPADSSDD